MHMKKCINRYRGAFCSGVFLGGIHHGGIWRGAFFRGGVLRGGIFGGEVLLVPLKVHIYSEIIFSQDKYAYTAHQYRGK